MTEESPMKKGRGRPRKSVVNVEDNGQEVKKTPAKEKPVAVVENGDSEGTEEEVAAPVTKSPSKKRQAAPESVPDGSDNEEAPAPAKRGRGRPRKTTKGASSKPDKQKKTATASKATGGTGRGRGRPRKNP